MEKIVTEGLKVDFHIHSRFSSGKDGSLVSGGTIENLPILVSKLKENSIDMCAITDHDCFNFDIYQALKQYQYNGQLRCVLPGIEFSVEMVGDNEIKKQIHVIAIFDDANEALLRNMSLNVMSPQQIHYDGSDEHSFSETHFVDLLSKIGLNAVLIVHQKNSETSKKPAARDLNSLGQETFDELISIEYFDALEFKSQKQAVFHAIFQKKQNENYEKIKFLTGSDCHQWEYYPKHDKSSGDDDTLFEPTFLKCLPSFRGLAMAVTDVSRISRNNDFFSDIRSNLSSIDFVIDGQPITIPLSKGINVIIGDNSVGKSALLNAITNYSCLDGTTGLPKELKDSYQKYWKNNHIEVKTAFPTSGDYAFDCQGLIKYEFAHKNNIDLLEDKFPEETDGKHYETVINDLLQPFYTALETKFSYDKQISEFSNVKTAGKPEKVNVCLAIQCSNQFIESYKTKGLKNLVKKISSSIEDIKALIPLLSNINEKEKMSDFLVFLNELFKKYSLIRQSEENNINILTSINLGILKYGEYINDLASSKAKEYSDYKSSAESIKSQISLALFTKQKIQKINFENVDPIKIEYNHNDTGEVSFVNRFKWRILSIDKSTLKSLVCSVLNKGTEFPDTSKITVEELNLQINNASDEKGLSGLSLLQSKISSQLEELLKSEHAIVKNGHDCTEEYSAGYNSTQYFSILANDQTKKVYLVDQPEDDVSQINISKYIVSDFRKMRIRHQIIMVTHNPLFVVNLDADNIIFLSKKDGKMSIQSGALEYVSDDTNMLNIIEDNLDGGGEALKKRWKRYDKSN
jgi:predicted ATPase